MAGTVKMHNSSYAFGYFTIEFAQNGYLVRRKDGTNFNRVEVYKNITDLVCCLVHHCGLVEPMDREIVLRAMRDEDYVGGHSK